MNLKDINLFLCDYETSQYMPLVFHYFPEKNVQMQN